MPLQRRPTSKWWYGRWEVNGKTHCKNLGVEIKGLPPLKRGMPGDAVFERVKGQAEVKLNQLVVDSTKTKQTEELLQSLHEIRSGHRVGSVKLTDLCREWDGISRRRSPSPRYAQCCHAVLESFVQYLATNHAPAAEMAAVTQEMAKNFLKAETGRGITGKTWNDELKLLRATFKHLRRKAGLVDNPFDEIPLKDTDTVNREPFTPAELKLILDAASRDAFIRPLIITAACTAMRRGDCCCLKWTDVDLPNRFVTVKTTKTGVTVMIPMFAPLYDLLRETVRTESEYCFPQQAEMYHTNPDGITWRVRKVLKAAGFHEPPDEESGKGEGSEQTRVRIKRKGSGLRLASIRDFHSFRVTWITLALSAGVPEELVRKVTGHITVDIVRKHYFQPGREILRNALNKFMPQLLMDGKHADPKAEMRRIISKMTPKSLDKDKERLVQLLTTI